MSDVETTTLDEFMKDTTVDEFMKDTTMQYYPQVGYYYVPSTCSSSRISRSSCPTPTYVSNLDYCDICDTGTGFLPQGSQCQYHSMVVMCKGKLTSTQLTSRFEISENWIVEFSSNVYTHLQNRYLLLRVADCKIITFEKDVTTTVFFKFC